MQTIITKYLCPTNQKGSRIKATSSAGLTITMSWRSDLDSEENHTLAAKALCKKLGWENELVSGDLKSGCVFVMLPSHQTIIEKKGDDHV